MARNAVTAKSGSDETKKTDSAGNPGMSTIVERADQSGTPLIKAPTMGGTMGIIPEAERRVMLNSLVTRSASHPLDEPQDAKQARNYKLLADSTFMYDGCKTVVRAGKIFSDSCYDIGLLQRQGLALQEIIAPVETARDYEDPAAEQASA